MDIQSRAYRLPKGGEGMQLHRNGKMWWLLKCMGGWLCSIDLQAVGVLGELWEVGRLCDLLSSGVDKPLIQFSYLFSAEVFTIFHLGAKRWMREGG